MKPHIKPLPSPARPTGLAAALTAALSLLLILWMSGCASPETGTPATPTASVPADPGVLRVGVTPNLPPMIFRKNGILMGLEADLAKDLAAHLGRQLRFVELPWEKQIDALNKGEIDIIMSSMTITTARQMRINFARPYMTSGQAALVRRDEVDKFRLFLFRDKFDVGVQEGTTGDYFAQQYLKNAKRVMFKDAEQGAKSLARNKIDMVIHDAPVIWWLASVNESAGLTVLPNLLSQESLAWGLRKEDTALLESVNQYLEESAQEGRLRAVISRWIPRFNF